MKPSNILSISALVMGMGAFFIVAGIPNSRYSELLLQNVEVLANGEGGNQKGDAVDDICNHTNFETGEICHESITLCLANQDIPCSQSTCPDHQK